MIKHKIFLLTVISTTSCGTGSNENADQEKHMFNVEYNGALKNMMHKGDISSKVDLKDLQPTHSERIPIGS